MTYQLDATSRGFAEEFDRLVMDKRQADEDVAATVSNIIADIRKRGDAAVLDYTEKFDRHRPDMLKLDSGEIEAAVKDCPADILNALKHAAIRIRSYHERQLPSDERYVDAAGVELGHRWRPLQAVGLYVPGGLAAYPSSVLMNTIPAKVAGVGRIAMAVPMPQGQANTEVLAAAGIAGVDEIYRIGGAQAVAALAYGTRTIAAVDKITGPGNAYVAEAKRQVFGQVGIDMIAGPSEVLIIADKHNNPDWIAADLLAQAEHDTAAQSILISDDAAFLEEVGKAVEKQLQTLPKAEIAQQSWQRYGALIRIADLDDAVELSDRLAPEHLEIATENAEDLAAKIHNAGAIFIGSHTPEAIGDYIGGPNHVLPTGRSARFSSGLNVLDFMKRTSLLKCSAEALREISGDAITLGRAEGLEAHARSVAIRLNL